jgi:hypothetical protein
MVSDELKALIERYEKYQNHKIITPQQKMFDLTMINLYKLGNKGMSVIVEVYLNDIQGLSKMELLKSLKEAEQRSFIKDISSHGGRRWILIKDGIIYVESLLDEIKK